MPTADDDAHDAEWSQPTIGDALRRWQYTLNPTFYVDESSDVTELLWQTTLEQRATRGWLVVLCVIMTLHVIVLTVVLAT